MKHFAPLVALLLLTLTSLNSALTSAETELQQPKVNSSWIQQDRIELEKRLVLLEANQQNPDKIDQLSQSLIHAEISLTKIDENLSKQVSQQNERIGDISAQVDRFGVITAWIGGGFAVLFTFLAVAFAISVRSSALAEARNTALEHIQEQAEALREQTIEELEKEKAIILKQIKREASQILNNIQQDGEAAVGELIQLKDHYTPEEEHEIQKQKERTIDKPEADYTAEDWFNKAISDYTNQDFKQTIQSLDRALGYPENSDSFIATTLFNKAFCYGKLSPPEESLEVETLQNLIKQFKENTEEDVQTTVARALLNLGFSYSSSSPPQTDKAIAACKQLIERFETSTYEDIQAVVAAALVNLGVAYSQKSPAQAGEAIATYKRLIDQFKSSSNEEIQNIVVSALCSKAEISLLIGDLEQTHSFINEALDALQKGKPQYPVMQLLLFIINKAPITAVISAIKNVDFYGGLFWSFDEIRYYLSRFEGEKKQQINAFVDFFENHQDVDKLEQELEAIGERLPARSKHNTLTFFG
ncbi:tetratricopeptide repeat protein [Neptunomonas sp. XY-337]|uniref:tetratricopeptide repeat protein n=1 Tax=Neptunomonas sp. XY-337 TaxID=2561897 RepID=UPI0010A9A119|nr:tetratricopeptide repeat protein [Neptunomonas sp. XY-337]